MNFEKAYWVRNMQSRINVDDDRQMNRTILREGERGVERERERERQRQRERQRERQRQVHKTIVFY